MTPPAVTLYSRNDCHLCEQAAQQLQALSPAFGLALRTIDIDADPALRRRYGDRVPVVALRGRELIAAPFDAPMLRAALTRALAAEPDRSAR